LENPSRQREKVEKINGTNTLPSQNGPKGGKKGGKRLDACKEGKKKGGPPDPADPPPSSGKKRIYGAGLHPLSHLSKKGKGKKEKSVKKNMLKRKPRSLFYFLRKIRKRKRPTATRGCTARKENGRPPSPVSPGGKGREEKEKNIQIRT